MAKDRPQTPSMIGPDTKIPRSGSDKIDAVRGAQLLAIAQLSATTQRKVHKPA